MENKAFQSLLVLIDDLTDEQRATFKKALDENNTFEKVAMLLDNRLLAKSECLYCKFSNVMKWGRQSGLQRMRCFDCGKSFNALTGTPLAHLRKKEEWLKMAAALKDGLTVKDTAEKCNSCISTAFRWRHRFLKAMKGDVAERLEGITEADETYFLESHKGSRNISRKATKRGLFNEQIPVLVARDRTGGIADAVLPDQPKKSIKVVLGGKISKENILCIDDGNALWGFACEGYIPCKVIPASKYIHERNPIFHIQNVNGCHSRLKNRMSPFNGVVTKYLPNYLGWRRMFEKPKPVLTPVAWLQAAAKPARQ